jgi:hypothetical protein
MKIAPRPCGRSVSSARGLCEDSPSRTRESPQNSHFYEGPSVPEIQNELQPPQTFKETKTLLSISPKTWNERGCNDNESNNYFFIHVHDLLKAKDMPKMGPILRD